MPGRTYRWGGAPASCGGFAFTSRNYSDYSATLSGNGYLLGATTWDGTAAAASTLAGVYDHLQVGSYPYQALIPLGTRWTTSTAATG
jgi:hypothetical protein